MPPAAPAAFADWLAELTALAEARELHWLVQCPGEGERAAHAQGLSPTDYLDRLDAMSEWRGCGCGGGS